MADDVVGPPSDATPSVADEKTSSNRTRADARPIFARHVTWFSGYGGNETGAFEVSQRFPSIRIASETFGLKAPDVRKCARGNMLVTSGKRFKRVKEWFFSYCDFDCCNANNEPAVAPFDVDSEVDGEEVWKFFSDKTTEQVSSWGRIRRRSNEGAKWNAPYSIKASKNCRARYSGKSFQNLVFEAFNGTIPMNHVVVRKNGKNDDFRVSNLESMPRRAGIQKRTSQNRVKAMTSRKNIRVRHYWPNCVTANVYENATACKEAIFAQMPHLLIPSSTIMRYIRRKAPYRGHSFSNADCDDPGPPPRVEDANDASEPSEASGEEVDEDDEMSVESEPSRNLDQWESVPREVADRAREILDMN